MNKDNLNTLCSAVGHIFSKGFCVMCEETKFKPGDYDGYSTYEDVYATEADLEFCKTFCKTTRR